MVERPCLLQDTFNQQGLLPVLSLHALFVNYSVFLPCGDRVLLGRADFAVLVLE